MVRPLEYFLNEQMPLFGVQYTIEYLLRISALQRILSGKAVKWDKLLNHVSRDKEIKVVT